MSRDDEIELDYLELYKDCISWFPDMELNYIEGGLSHQGIKLIAAGSTPGKSAFIGYPGDFWRSETVDTTRIPPEDITLVARRVTHQMLEEYKKHRQAYLLKDDIEDSNQSNCPPAGRSQKQHNILMKMNKPKFGRK